MPCWFAGTWTAVSKPVQLMLLFVRCNPSLPVTWISNVRSMQEKNSNSQVMEVDFSLQASTDCSEVKRKPIFTALKLAINPVPQPPPIPLVVTIGVEITPSSVKPKFNYHIFLFISRRLGRLCAVWPPLTSSWSLADHNTGRGSAVRHRLGPHRSGVLTFSFLPFWVSLVRETVVTVYLLSPVHPNPFNFVNWLLPVLS
ncbi:hypothetical protein GQ457_15G009450 [Hibiscus cannabinus]